jgi:hypothetical protein
MRAYYMRLLVAELAEAETLAEALAEQEAVLSEREGAVVSLLWPQAEADEPDEWDEGTFVELVFFLRAWSGDDPGRQLIVLEERPVEVPTEIFRRAS